MKSMRKLIPEKIVNVIHTLHGEIALYTQTGMKIIMALILWYMYMIYDIDTIDSNDTNNSKLIAHASWFNLYLIRLFLAAKEKWTYLPHLVRQINFDETFIFVSLNFHEFVVSIRFILEPILYTSLDL